MMLIQTCACCIVLKIPPRDTLITKHSSVTIGIITITITKDTITFAVEILCSHKIALAFIFIV